MSAGVCWKRKNRDPSRGFLHERASALTAHFFGQPV